MKHEYHKGQEAAERFEKLATAMFLAPKSIVKPEGKPARPNVRKPAKVSVCACRALATDAGKLGIDEALNHRKGWDDAGRFHLVTSEVTGKRRHTPGLLERP